MNKKIYSKKEIINAIEGIDLIDTIEKGFVEYSKGNSVVPPVGELLFTDPPGDVHIKYGYIKGHDNYVIKIASGFPENNQLGLSTSHGVMVMFDSRSGYLKCILHDEGYLTNVRTAVAGSICAKYLAPKKVTKIGIIGTGIQARLQLKYIKYTTRCVDVMVLGRDSKKINDYIEDMRKEGFNLEVANNSKQLCESCNLVVTTTSANESLINKSDIKPGTHITAVGSDTPEKRELDSNILGLANLVVVDSVSQCVERGETKYALEKNIINRSDLVELGYVIMSKNNGRLSEDDITVADLTGVAVQDIMITNTVYNNLNQL